MNSSDAPVEIVSYDPAWPTRFEEEAAILRRQLARWLVGPIEHIGSTAVPGLAAKPVIDIMAGVQTLEDSCPAIAAATELGYCYWPYQADLEHWFCKPSTAFRTHHLHLIPVGTPQWFRTMAFRDYLRAHAHVAHEYAALKQRLAQEHRFDREGYTAAKRPFIDRITEMALASTYTSRSTVSPSIQAVIFDLDGTLLDRRRSFERFARDQWVRFAHSVRTVDQQQYVQILIDRDRDGYASRQELFAGLVTQFELPPTLAETLLHDYRAGFPSSCVLFPDAAETLASLRAAGLKLGLITNGSVRMQRRKLECLGISPMFDTILISDAEGIHKPDRRIFRRALERLNTTPARSVFVGDHPDVDVVGARAAGMQAIWRRDARVSRVVEADAVIEELSDLLPLLRLGGRGLPTLVHTPIG